MTMAVARKPFLAGPPVTGELFAGREKEMARLLHLVKEGQPVAILSPRKLGKTSLIKQSEPKMRGIIPVYIDCWEIYSKEEFAEALIEKTVEAYSTFGRKPELTAKVKHFFTKKISELMDSVRSVEGEIGGILRIIVEFRERSAGSKAMVNAALNFPEKLAKERKVRFALIFDEFQNLREFNGELLKAVRANIQHHQNVSYVISGSQQSALEFLLLDSSSPFYRMFEFIRLGSLDGKTAGDFVKGRFNKFGVRISEQDILRICSLTGNHPFYLQKLCLKVYNNHSLGGRRPPSPEAAYDEMMDELWPSFEESFGALDKAPIQKDILKIMAIYGAKTAKQASLKRNDLSVQSANQLLRELVSKGFLVKEGRGRYEFSDAIFKEFLRRRFSSHV